MGERAYRSTSGARNAWLGGYGLATIALGSVVFLMAGSSVLGGPPLTEANFVGHLTQSHESTVIGLGVIALGLRKSPGNLRSLYTAICIAGVLGALIYLLSTPISERGTYSLFMVLNQLFWAAGFGYLLWREAAGIEVDNGRALPRWAQFVVISFCVLVVLSGLVWLLAPLKFATAAAGALAGQSAVFAGQTRGAADVAIGLASWGALRSTPSRKRILIGALFANLLLVIAGGLAQASPLYNPTRWIVEGLHIFWSVGLLTILLRRSLT